MGLVFWQCRQEVCCFTRPGLTLRGIREGVRVEQRRGKRGRSAVPRVTGMYSKHRQKNAQISPAKCGRLLVFLCFLSLSGTLDRANGDTGGQGRKKSGHACKTSFFKASTSCVLRHWECNEEHVSYEMCKVCRSVWLLVVDAWEVLV